MTASPPPAAESIPREGFLYLVWGQRSYLDEAIASCRSLKAVSPQAHATIAIDHADEALRAELASVFDHVVAVDAAFPADFEASRPDLHFGYTYKVRNIYRASPYERTCFLDTDTYLLEPIDGLFKLLDHFDLAVAPAPGDVAPSRDQHGEIVPGYTPYNTGVICYAKNDVTAALFECWESLQHEVMAGQRGGPDQETFAQALLDSPARFYVLQTSWNARLPYADRFVQGVRVVHSRPRDMGGLSVQDAARRVNHSRGIRVWLAGINEVYYHDMSLGRWLLISLKGTRYFTMRALYSLSRFRIATVVYRATLKRLLRR